CRRGNGTSHRCSTSPERPSRRSNADTGPSKQILPTKLTTVLTEAQEVQARGAVVAKASYFYVHTLMFDRMDALEYVRRLGPSPFRNVGQPRSTSCIALFVLWRVSDLVCYCLGAVDPHSELHARHISPQSLRRTHLPGVQRFC